MTRTKHLAALAIITTATSAHADVPQLCKLDGVRAISASLSDLGSDDAFDALPEIINLTCNPDSRDAVDHKAELAAARAKWAKRLDLTDADWADVAAWSALGNGQKVTALRWQPGAWSAMDPIAQYARMSSADDMVYFADALGPHLSELGRFGYVNECIKSQKPVEWALCQPDIDALDTAKMLAEIRADTHHGPEEKMMMRVWVDARGKALADHAKAVAEVKAKDETYGKVFELAAAERKSWDASPPDAKLLSVIGAMDDARVTQSRKAFAGCGDSTWEAFKGAVGALPAKKFANVKDDRDNPFIQGAMGVILGDRDGYLAAVARYECTADKPDILTRFLGDSLQRWPGFRGPRSAALTAILRAGLQLDDKSAQLEIPDVRRMWFQGSGGISGGGAGVVSAIKASGETSTIEFAKKMRKAQVCAEWRDEHRISMISSSGTVYYEYTCIKYTSVMVNDAPAPVTVKTIYAAGTKVGSTVSVYEEVVSAVWPKPGAAPSVVFGVPVK